jgi:hypothetical protein
VRPGYEVGGLLSRDTELIRDVSCCAEVWKLRLSVRTIPQEPSDHIIMLVSGRNYQRRAAFQGCFVDIGAENIDKAFQYIEVAILRRDEQGRSSEIIYPIDVSAKPIGQVFYST